MDHRLSLGNHNFLLRGCRLPRNRNSHLNDRAALRTVMRQDVAAVLLHDAIADAQT